MKLTINKIGKIKKAEINVNGLTLIAGKNDTGKSTVGKILYAIFRGIALKGVFFEQMKKKELIEDYIRPLFRRCIALSGVDSGLKNELAKLLDNSAYLSAKDPKDLLSELKPEALLEIIEKIIKLLDENFPEDIKQYAYTAKEGILSIQNADFNEKISYIFGRTFSVMFNGAVLNSKYRENANVSIYQDKDLMLEAKIERNNFSARMDEVLSQSGFVDVVYVESPFLLDLVSVFGKPNWGELISSLYNKTVPKDWGAETNKDLTDFIQKNILQNAKVTFKESTRDFVYQVDDESEKITMDNVACGVKSFTLLMLLLKLNILSKDTLLIVDEPENHLHPEFQIKYAELVCLLVQKGFSVVLTSHSPTFIQAIGAYSNKYKIKNKTSFYLAEQVPGENYSVIADKTENLNDIYRDLVYPVERLFMGE